MSRRALNERCEIVHLGAVRDARGVGVLELVPEGGDRGSPLVDVAAGFGGDPGAPRRFCRIRTGQPRGRRGGPRGDRTRGATRGGRPVSSLRRRCRPQSCVEGVGGRYVSVSGSWRGVGRGAHARLGIEMRHLRGMPRTSGRVWSPRVPRRAGGSRERIRRPRARRTRVVVPRHGRFGVWLGAFRRRRFREQRHQVRAPRCRRRRPLSGTPSRRGFPRRSHRARDRANSRPRPAPRASGGGGAGWDDD